MRVLAVLCILTLLAPGGPVLGAPVSDTRLEGLVLGLDGIPAAGYRVHLIDESGVDSARAQVDAEGMYRIHDVRSGRYSLALETPEGRYVRVEAPPLSVKPGRLLRNDLKLAERDPAQPSDLPFSPGFGTWWAGMNAGAKVWTVAAIVLVIGISAEALSSDETLASPTTPQ